MGFDDDVKESLGDQADAARESAGTGWDRALDDDGVAGEPVGDTWEQTQEEAGGVGDDTIVEGAVDDLGNPQESDGRYA